MENRGWEFGSRPTEVRVETHLNRFVPKTAEQIAGENGVEVDQLTELVDKRASELLAECWRKRGSQSRDTDGEIKFLFECFLAVQGRDDLESLSSKISTPEGFYRAYVRKGRQEAMRTLGLRINDFMWRVGDPDAVIELYDFEMVRSPVQGEFTKPGEYLYLPVQDKYSEAVLVDSKVVDEMIEIQRDSRVIDSDLYHVSNSAALPGIARKKAILAAQKAREEGHQLITGEYASDGNKNIYEGDASIGGLEAIYADSLPRMGYSFINWFDRWPVVFATSQNKVREHAERVLGVEAPLMIREPKGIQIGSEVTMDMLEIVMCNLDHEDELKKWALENCPGTVVLSLEAFDLYRQRTLYPSEESERVRDWKSFKEKAKKIHLS